ncbi:MAG TPA: ATP synthase subunit I [Gammaproteobacteria bacterium]|nr:ATP synthase subunit I [Gammaproteobacteria bacterium]
MDTGYLAEARRAAYRVVGWQILAALVAGFAGFLIGGRSAGGAAVTGGLIAALAQLVVTLRVYGGARERDPKRFLGRLVLGEALKFAATALLFAVAIVVMKAAFMPLILGYLAGFAAYWIGFITSSIGQAR